MSGQQKHTRQTSRVLSWACLVLIPAFAIVALGSGLSLVSTGAGRPKWQMLAETRDFATKGDTVTAVQANPARTW